MRQNNGPGGNCGIFLSAIGLTSNCCAEAGDHAGAANNIAASHRRNVRLEPGTRKYICTPLAFVSVAPDWASATISRAAGSPAIQFPLRPSNFAKNGLSCTQGWAL